VKPGFFRIERSAWRASCHKFCMLGFSTVERRVHQKL